MEFARVGLVLAIFLSVGRSAPVSDCESLTRPVQINRDNMLGKWFYIGESTNLTGSQLLTKTFMDTVWGNFTAASQEDGINACLFYKIMGSCFSASYSSSLVNNTVSVARPYPSTAVQLSTSCPDCLVFHSKATFGTKTYSGTQLLSRRSEVTAAQLEEYKRQVECLQLSSPVILDSSKGFCPESETEGTKVTDLTEKMNNVGAQILQLFSSEDGLNTFIELINSSVAKLTQ